MVIIVNLNRELKITEDKSVIFNKTIEINDITKYIIRQASFLCKQVYLLMFPLEGIRNAVCFN